MNFCIFIPAYNAGQYLRETVGRIPEDVWRDVISVWIIDDGSRDDTANAADDLSRENPRIHAHHFPQNRGYGPAVKKGLALCKNDGCDCAICLHADGQYAPEMIPAFAAGLRDYDLMQGSRIASGTALSGGMPLYKFVANRILTFFENIVFGLSLTDYHSGYLVYGRKALDTIVFERLSDSFDFDLEVIASARSRGLKIGEIPIQTRYAGERSHVKSVEYGVRCLRVMGKYILGQY